MSAAYERPDRGDAERPDRSVPARLHLVRRTTVEQAIEGHRFGQFNKEILRAETPSGRVLSLVRKHRDDLPRRGAVLLVHGLAQNRYSWHLSTRSFVNFLADAGLDVYNLELTGHGRGREFGTSPARAFTDYVEDTEAVLRAVAVYSGERRIFVVGHSLGGAVLYAVAPAVQDLLAGVVGLAAIYRFGSNPMTRRLADFIEAAAPVVERVADLGAGIRARALGDAMARRWQQADLFNHRFPMAGWEPGSTEPHVLQERLTRGFDWTGVRVLVTMMRWAHDDGIRGEDGQEYAERFAELDLPLLVVAGDKDRLLPPADARPAYDLSASTDKTYKLFSASGEGVSWGHLDIVLGKHAPAHVWPYLRSWILDRCAPTSDS